MVRIYCIGRKKEKVILLEKDLNVHQSSMYLSCDYFDIEGVIYRKKYACLKTDETRDIDILVIADSI